MLPSVRKDLESLEARLDSMLEKQTELDAALGALRVHLATVMQSETNDLDAGIALKFQEQSRWLASKFSELRADILEQNALDKSENLAVVAALETRQTRQIESLRALLAQEARTAQTRHQEFWQQLGELKRAQDRDAELEIDDVSPQALKNWSELVGTRLKKFGETQGMPRSFAGQLLQELKELTELNRQFDDENIAWEERLDELQRVLFGCDRAMPWTSLTPHNATPTQRRELRALETAVAQLRSYVQENLLRTTGVRPLEIVPRISPFDASVHESNEFLEVPTTETNKHNLILSVEQMGFQKLSSLGEAQLLRPARVRRYVLQDGELPADETEIASVENDAPRLSGQL